MGPGTLWKGAADPWDSVGGMVGTLEAGPEVQDWIHKIASRPPFTWTPFSTELLLLSLTQP